ncbi:radical SAM-linked protein [Parelusimicrobium proximum]|uniref:TIGR03936 family radical SAM-associated protein n=1 Tax=Parelusimicrobium proximum TaxID=3228953 RepID=UPI003D1668B2
MKSDQTVSKIYKMRIRYSADGSIGNGEAGRILREKIAASGLGFVSQSAERPGPRISLGTVLVNGIYSECEYADIFLNNKEDERYVLKKLVEAAPEGVTITEVKRIPNMFPSVPVLAEAAEYLVQVQDGELFAVLDKFFKSSTINVNVSVKGKEEEVNMKDYIYSYDHPAETEINIKLLRVKESEINLYAVTAKCLQDHGLETSEAFEKIKIIKKNLYWRNSLGGLELI